MRTARAIATAAVCLLVLCIPGSSRLVQLWQYDRLTSTAKLVIIGSPGKTTPTKEKYEGNHPWPFEIVGVETRVTVLAVLKGREKKKTITLFHFQAGPLKKEFRDKGGPTPVIDDPDFLSFRTEPLVVKTEKGKVTLPPPDYLLFLRRRKDGRYEAITGPLDATQSVRELYGHALEAPFPRPSE
jgi:hypothetical protein